MKEILILGAGAMGSAFAFPCADNGHKVCLVGTHLEDNFIDKDISLRDYLNEIRVYLIRVYLMLLAWNTVYLMLLALNTVYLMLLVLNTLYLMLIALHTVALMLIALMHSN